jgi:hypothetical protein
MSAIDRNGRSGIFTFVISFAIIVALFVGAAVEKLYQQDKFNKAQHAKIGANETLLYTIHVYTLPRIILNRYSESKRILYTDKIIVRDIHYARAGVEGTIVAYTDVKTGSLFVPSEEYYLFIPYTNIRVITLDTSDFE